MAENIFTRLTSPVTGLARGTFGEIKKSPFDNFFSLGAQLKLLLPVVIVIGVVLILSTLLLPYYIMYKGVTK